MARKPFEKSAADKKTDAAGTKHSSGPKAPKPPATPFGKPKPEPVPNFLKAAMQKRGGKGGGEKGC